MNRTDLKDLANERIAEVKILLDAGKWSGAYYLAGYAVECGLKACIAKLSKPDEFPDKNFGAKCWVHDIKQLVALANLEDQRKTDTDTNSDLAARWKPVFDWNERSRYERKSQTDAQVLYDAITHDPNGVLPWIRLRW